MLALPKCNLYGLHLQIQYAEEQAIQIFLRSSAFWPLINIAEIVVDGNSGFRAVSDILHGQDSVWPEIGQRLLDVLNSHPTGYLRDFAVTSSAEISLVGEPHALCCAYLGQELVV